MILDKGLGALIFAGFFCLAAALGGGARAAEVYAGCAEPGPTEGKVWWVDPINGKPPHHCFDGLLASARIVPPTSQAAA